MFIDRVRIKVTGGAGGNGCVSFRREKYVPRGGPDGGDGGDGGSVYLKADPQLDTLLDLKYQSHVKGKRGVHGKGSGCHGAAGDDVVIPVPCGTQVLDYQTGRVLADLTEEGETYCAARGGRGGKGNARFASSKNQAPRFAELGEPGEEREYLLELKLLADVGIVGLPNAGKSTLLSVTTGAHPKIGAYPFTTLSPNLGIVQLSDYRTLTLADIPGIIEGAAEGKGLGHDFLRHIERTHVLLFLIDLGDADPMESVHLLERELEEYSAVLAERPRVYALNKADIPENREKFRAISDQLHPAFCISAATHEGVNELLEALWKRVDEVKKAVPESEEGREKEYAYEAPYAVEAIPGGFRVEGHAVRRAVLMTDFDNDEAVRHLQKKLQKLGVFNALKRMGAQEGETIYVDSVELVYQPD